MSGKGQTQAKKEPPESEKKQESNEKDLKSKKDVLKEEREGLQKRINVKKETREKLRESKIKSFFEGVFGKNNRVSGFLSGIFGWVASKLGFSKEIPWDEFSKEIEKQEENASKKPFDIEEFIVSHRSLGYGRHKENSKEAIKAALDGGEKQTEIDLRKGKDGKIYLSHDSIKELDNPGKKYLSLNNALEIYAQHSNQEVAIFFDVKEPEILDILDEMIDKIDEKYKGREGYLPLKDRNIINSFNPKILAKAVEKNRKRPVLYGYFPAVKLIEVTGQEKIVDSVGKKGIRKICKSIDSLTGSSLAKELDSTDIKINDNDPLKSADSHENIIHIYNTLPSEDILNIIRESQGYICVPSVLATPKLIEEAHAKGVKVAVWGAEGKHIQKAIAVLKADLIISDRPDVIKGQIKAA